MQERSQLGAGENALGLQPAVVHAAQDARADSPVDGVNGAGGDAVGILEGAQVSSRVSTSSAPKTVALRPVMPFSRAQVAAAAYQSVAFTSVYWVVILSTEP